MSIGIWFGAVCPIIILFLAMSVFHMKTERAAFLGILFAAASALLIGKSSLFIVGMDLAKGAFSALNILIVIWPAVFLYEMLEYADVFQCIKQMIQKKTQDELVLILLICWLFASFLQGITGFGVPVAVCAPLLIAVGVKPLWAVMITLLGHAWANTYGTFALAWDALITQSETTHILMTKIIAGALLWGVNIAGALLICWFYGKGKALRHMLPFVLVISTVQGGGQLLVSLVNSTIAAFIPTTLALAVGWLILNLGFYTKPWKMDSGMMRESAQKVESASQGKEAVFPFVLLAAISVILLLIPPIHTVLNRAVLQLSFPAVETGRGFVVEATTTYGTIHIFTHAGFVLLLTVLITYFLYKKKGMMTKEKMKDVRTATWKKILPTSLGILFLVMMAQVLKGSGLMELVARGVTQVTGEYYSFAVPFLGLLGAFVTSSNTSSNILLGSFQKTAADLLAVNEAAVLAAQTAGGAIGTVVGPSTILLGTTTAGCKGKEGDVLKFMLPIVLLEAVLTGLVAGILTL
ncbi:MAG: L-lactate permease [Eubacteriales bacterium]|nr:L-lactate permease [Eubacteriales bacterium]